ncbi:MAG: Hsp20/alpha crystallin family protein [Bacteroidales bacterium]|jgi:HSP20 family protein|nr:Hsp20/alpha crystallin family protein [Bacteroidales bacterium]
MNSYKLRLENPTIEFMKVFDDLFDETFDVTSRKCPTHDVIENDEEFIIKMELAGVKKKDINIDTENDVLTIEAERTKDDELKYNRNELYTGKYKRSFILPDTVDVEGIEAELSNGILTITISKIVD